MFRPTSTTLQRAASQLKPYANMLRDPGIKYRAFQGVPLPDRTWPDKRVTKPPRWLSTDLRDGNQSLPDPMSTEEKKEFFHMLVDIGFKEIEVAFPSASQTDFDFTRYAVENAPSDVSIQVLCQSREPLIRRTVESVTGAKKAIIHVYLAISDLFREVVFKMSKEEAIQKAIETTKLVRSLTKDDPAQQGTEWTYQFSPETFSDAPTDFAIEICEAVKKEWGPSEKTPLVFNLPATVEVAPPNVYADQIEYFCRNLSEREKVSVSVHTHNDRGCGIAAVELALTAGADRVEGCLFGSGERTGNVDLVTLALNMYTDGVSPNLDFSDIESVIRVVEKCNNIPVHPRTPYGGSLVVSAFSGSHQDAIKKGFASSEKRQAQGDIRWEVPYLPLDPKDIGRNYEAVIRVNSQSGKGGAAWVILRSLGLDLPRSLQVAFSGIVQRRAEVLGRELQTEEIIALFKNEYMNKPDEPIILESFEVPNHAASANREIKVVFLVKGEPVTLHGTGNGPISSFIDAISSKFGTTFEVVNYFEHLVGSGALGRAATYIQLKYLNERGVECLRWGCAIHTDVSQASLQAIMAIFNASIVSQEIKI